MTDTGFMSQVKKNPGANWSVWCYVGTDKEPIAVTVWGMQTADKGIQEAICSLRAFDDPQDLFACSPGEVPVQVDSSAASEPTVIEIVAVFRIDITQPHYPFDGDIYAEDTGFWVITMDVAAGGIHTYIEDGDSLGSVVTELDETDQEILGVIQANLSIEQMRGFQEQTIL